ncbi:MAG: TonB-dependent receptor [Ekhidna sp.]|uniref:TonB-dependent receptor n=1 Tax=Ekhidna sp. TaxID=2608089 RepID=UPI0032EC12D8
MRAYIYIGLISFLCFGAHAQSDSTKTGQVVSGEVVIEKDKKITLPQADKIFLKSEPKSFQNDPINVQFNVQEPSFEWPDYKSDVPYQFVQDPYPIEEYQNYVKLGYGNYGSPLLEAGLFKTFGGFSTNTKLFYESFKSGPVNDENSGNRLGGVDLGGSYTTGSIVIKPSISFQHRQYNFYGNADRQNTGYDTVVEEVLYDQFNLGVSLSGQSEEVSYEIRPSFGLSNQRIDGGTDLNKESVFNTTGNFSYKIDEAFTTGFELEGNVSSYDGGLSYDRSLLNVNPWVTHYRENLSITAGFMISSGKVGSGSKTGFYPNISAEYDLSDKWTVFGLFSGGQSWNGLSQLLDENEFLDDSLAITHTEYTTKFGGGIKGSPIKNMLFEASITNSSTKGLPFYTPSVSDSSRYILSYDTENVNILTLESGISYMPTTTSTYGAKLQINGYSVESLDRPWHRPSFVFEAYTSHNIQEKLIVSAHLTTIGGIRAPANVDFGYVKLPAFTDIGIGAKYLITQRASAFIDVNNLLNNEYERYLGYPIRGLAFKIGGQYRF